MKKSFVLILTVGLIVLVFFKFGRSIWYPIMTKIKGAETVESVNEKYQKPVGERLKPYLKQNGLTQFPDKIMLIALKEEKELELWAKDNSQWKKIKTYPFTAFSGKLGPKLKEGDRQIPEGIYSIEYLNPNSSYHLSLKINYPNEFDKKKAESDGRTNLGSDIFIHGKDVTIGCIPIGDSEIEEIFILASIAIKNGIKVIISPRDFRIGREYPKIESVTWKNELYDLIKSELNKYSVNGIQ